MQQLVDIDFGRFPARQVGHGFILLCALLGPRTVTGGADPCGPDYEGDGGSAMLHPISNPPAGVVAGAGGGLRSSAGPALSRSARRCVHVHMAPM